MKVAQILNRWLALRRMSIRQRTYEHYADTIRLHLIPALGDLDPADDDADIRIASELGELMAAGMQRTAEAAYVILKAAFRTQRINPMACIPKPKREAVRYDAWTDEQIQRYGAALSGPSALPLLIGLSCGLRKGEICALTWADIDLSGEVIHIRRQIVRTRDGLTETAPKSAAGVRYVPIPGYLMAILLQISPKTGRIWPYTPEALYAAHRRTATRAGLPACGLHMLRHAYAMTVVRHGGAVTALQRILGHRHYNTTADIYAPADRELLMQTAQRLPVITLTLNQGVQGSSP